MRRSDRLRLALLTAFTMPAAGLAGSCDRLAALDGVPDTAPGGAVCSTYIGQTGGQGVSCHWEFGFRDDAAGQFATGLWAALQACRPGQALAADQQVNHPDSYDLREWQAGRDIYSVSVKDKGGQDRTLVFLRLERRAR